MAALIFEIWRDEEEGSFTLLRVTERNDEFRRKTMPHAKMVHGFAARSDFDASQKYYDWHGWGLWKPEPDWQEEFFSDADADEQNRYLAVRTQS